MSCSFVADLHVVRLQEMCQGINPLKTKHICGIKGLSPYRVVNTLHVSYTSFITQNSLSVLRIHIRNVITM
jgi:hypothetical protein